MIYLLTLTPLAIVLFVYSLKSPYRLVALHLIGRGVIDSINEYTYIGLVGGMSIAKLYSVFYIGVFIFYIVYKKYALHVSLALVITVYIFIALISSVMTEYQSGFMTFSTKWIYFYLLLVVAIQLGKNYNSGQLSTLLLLVSIYPIINQLLLAIIQGPKCIPGQVICSYVGSFYHESELASWIFIYILGTAIGLSYFTGIKKKVCMLLFVVGVFSLYLNGYRTATLALAIFIFLMYIRNFKKIHLLANVSILLFALGMIGVFHDKLLSIISVYIEDIILFVNNPSEYFSFSTQPIKSDLFSGRLYLFNQILYLYYDGGILVYLFGIGPEAISYIIGTFAHNEYISTLVELGFIGFMIFSILLFKAYYMIKSNNKYVYESMFISVLITALATMPFHDLRALILMSLVIGFAYGEKYKLKSL
ncbi:MAG: O-antigen ligase family protein [Candidatus Thiodiazotropha taylori]